MSNFQQYPPAPQPPHNKPMSKEARIGWSILAGFAIFVLEGSGYSNAALAKLREAMPRLTVVR